MFLACELKAFYTCKPSWVPGSRFFYTTVSEVPSFYKVFILDTRWNRILHFPRWAIKTTPSWYSQIDAILMNDPLSMEKSWHGQALIVPGAKQASVTAEDTLIMWETAVRKKKIKWRWAREKRKSGLTTAADLPIEHIEEKQLSHRVV